MPGTRRIVRRPSRPQGFLSPPGLSARVPGRARLRIPSGPPGRRAPRPCGPRSRSSPQRHVSPPPARRALRQPRPPVPVLWRRAGRPLRVHMESFARAVQPCGWATPAGQGAALGRRRRPRCRRLPRSFSDSVTGVASAARRVAPCAYSGLLSRIISLAGTAVGHADPRPQHVFVCGAPLPACGRGPSAVSRISAGRALRRAFAALSSEARSAAMTSSQFGAKSLPVFFMASCGRNAPWPSVRIPLAYPQEG